MESINFLIVSSSMGSKANEMKNLTYFKEEITLWCFKLEENDSQNIFFFIRSETVINSEYFFIFFCV